MYNFDKLLDRHNTSCAKWDGMYRSFGSNDLIPMFVADMDFECLPEIADALVKRAQHPTYGYTIIPEGFYSSIIEWNKKRNNFEFTKEQMILIPGCVCATVFTIMALTQPKDKVMFHTPIYYPFFSCVKDSDRTLVTASLKSDGNGYFYMDFDELEEIFKTQDIKMYILCSPHNPCGRVWTKEELTTLVDLCHKYGVYIFTDEIHSDIVPVDNNHIPLLALSDKAREISVLAAAPSKTFNIAGIKSSFFVIQNPELYEKVSALVKSMHVGLDLFAYAATEVAYSKGEVWVDEMNTYIRKSAEFVVDFCHKNTKIKAFVPQSTFLMWLDFSAYGLPQDELKAKCCEAGVAMNDGAAFGTEGLGYMRMNIGTPLFMIEKALKQIKEVFDKI